MTWVVVDTPYWHILIVMTFVGLGVGVTLPPMSRSVIGMVEPRRMGVVSGIFNMFRNLGGPFGIAVSATLFGNRVALRAKDAFLNGAQQAGIPSSVLEALGRAQQAGGQVAPDLALKLGPLASKLTQLQQLARVHGMAGAVVDVAWVLLAICGASLILAMFLPNLTPLPRVLVASSEAEPAGNPQA